MRLRSWFISTSIVTLLMTTSVVAEITLPAIINSQMVVQSGVKAPIWGWAAPGEKVSVSFADQTKSTVASDSGKWIVKLDPLAVSTESRQMVIKGENTITLEDVSSWREAARSAVESNQWVSANMKVPRSMVSNAIYNGMVAPLVPYAVKGAVWYQGEANRASKDYFEKLKALTAGWSKVFNVPAMPFYLVQVAPYNYAHAKAPKMTHQAIYDSVVCAQYRAAKEIKGVDVITIPDTVFGNVKNVHPNHKKTAGDRLAALALNHDYGKDVVWTGPRFLKAVLDGSSVKVSFEHVDQGLETSDGKDPNWFEIAGEDKVFVTAQAKIVGDKVIVSSPEVTVPEYIRMAWNNIAEQNLRDKNGWPAFSFNAEVTK